MLRSSMTTYGLLMEAYIRGDSVDEAMDIYYSLKDYMEMQPVTAQQKGLLFDTRFYTRLITTLTNHTAIATDSGDDWVSPHLGYTVDDGAEEIMNVEMDSSRGLRLAITLFQDMRQQGLPADQAIYLSLLARCGQEKDGYYLQQVHQYLRMDDGIELDEAMAYGLMDAYRRVGDEDAMVFELWENIGDSNSNSKMLDLVLDLCREKKYKHHAARIWIQLGPEQRTPTSYRQIVACLCESGEWQQAKELLVDLGKDRPGYTDLVELLVEYGHQQGVQADQWNDLV
ncbi:hypothetical protein BCR42DRAFT_408106 [Absidia repens]|uniref:Pentacotripeptide-repeat region of PRORP domain-containing protein n=1 Tax=Absidia repens TaxID=90262 RepID=A0A1X2IT57_9FUNG|nr:hypothetical protein BCR42DRAFT_408106 [Absidia repens]